LPKFGYRSERKVEKFKNFLTQLALATKRIIIREYSVTESPSLKGKHFGHFLYKKFRMKILKIRQIET
jgi:hypothetical protein